MPHSSFHRENYSEKAAGCIHWAGTDIELFEPLTLQGLFLITMKPARQQQMDTKVLGKTWLQSAY
jgi:hypothetical protein